MNLYPHNQQAHDSVMSKFDSGEERVCIVHATGTGKSYIIAAVSSHFSRVLVLAPMSFVLDETRKVCASHVDFATYSSLLYSLPDKQYDLIVLDEFHRAGAETWGARLQDLFSRNPQARIFGVTATPDRNDGNNMCESLFHGNVASQLLLPEAMRRGILAKPKAYVCGMYSFDGTFRRYSSRINAADITDEKRDELRKKLNAIQNSWEQSEGVASIIRQYFDQSYHRRVIVFCPTIAKLKSMMCQVKKWFSEAGITRQMKYYRIDSELTDEALSDMMKQYCTDEPNVIKVAFAVNMLNEGVHVPGVDCIICLRSTNSHIIMYQQIGRCLSAGGRPALILDLVSNIDRLRTSITATSPDDPSSSSSRSRTSISDTCREAEEYPFEIIAFGKDMLEELDSLNRGILGYYTDDDILLKVQQLAEQYEYIVDIPKEYKCILNQFYQRFGAAKLHEYLKSSRRTDYTLPELIESASHYRSPTEWKYSKDKKYWVYTCKYGLIDKVYTAVGWNIRTSRTYQDCVESARQYNTYADWQNADPTTYSYAVKKKWNVKIKNEIFNGGARRSIDSYTKDECAKVAKGYDTPKALRLGNRGTWDAIQKNGWVLDVCSHMQEKSLWPYMPALTHDECLSLCRNYPTKKKMRIENHRLLSTIIENHWESEMFSHFPRYSSANA